MSLTQDSAKALINRLYEKRAKWDDNTSTLAHTLSSLIQDTLSGDKYIGELLQNADDAKSPAIFFALVDGYLIVSYQGRHFNEKDVVDICDAAKPDRDKVHQSDQIGNKGIGFKAVFSLSDEVSILSEHVCFRFDKNYQEWKAKPDDMPWQIIPIYTESSYFPASINSQLKRDWVTVIIRLKPNCIEEIHNQLNQFSTRYLLFLRHIKTYELNLPDKKPKTITLSAPEQKCMPKKGSKPTDFTIHRLAVWENRAWWIYQKNCAMPDDLKRRLQTAEGIPEKYKTWTHIPISIALLEKDGKLVPLSSIPKVFCYLPTGLDFGFRFAVNAEFLLDSSRMLLRKDGIGNAWNGFIIKCMVEEQVRFLSQITRSTNLWRNIFDILTKVPESSSDERKTAFQNAIDKFYLTVDIPAKFLLRCKGAKVDVHGFIKAFGSEALQKQAVHPEVENTKLILELGAEQFQSAEIIDEIQKKEFSQRINTPETNKAFVKFISALSGRLFEEPRKKLDRSFQDGQFVLDAKNNLQKPSEVYFPDGQLKFIAKNFDFVVVVHPVIAAMDRTWLTKIGVKTLTLAKIIGMANNSKENLIAFVRTLATGQKPFSEDDWKILRSLKLIAANGEVVSAANLYLPDALNPDLRLQAYFSDASVLFCHSDYIKDQSPENQTKIKQFLLKLGVQTSLTESILPEVVEAANASSTPDQLIQLTQLLYQQFFKGKQCSEAVLKALKTVKIVCKDGSVRAAENVYLANAYSPKKPLEGVVEGMVFASEKYLTPEIDIQEFSSFLLTIGVQQDIQVVVQTRRNDLNRETLIENFPDAKKYFEYLKKAHPGIYDANTGRYMYQHYLEGAYVHIPFCDVILCAPLFWEILRDYWSEFGAKLNAVTYKTYYTEKPVPSNIHYLVQLAVSKKYGEDEKPEAYFCEAIREKFGAYVDDCLFADITQTLTLEQGAVLGFKATFSKEQALEILNRIANANTGQLDFSKIAHLYQNIIKVLISESEAEPDPEAEPELQMPNLLARDNQFKPANELVYLMSDPLPDSKNPTLIKKPGSIDDASFTRLCESFKITCVPFSVLTPELTEEIHSTLIESIRTKLIFCVYAVARKNDWSGEELKKQCAALKIQLEDAFSSITLRSAREVVIKYDDFLAEPQDCWIDEAQKTVYHVPYNDLDHQHRQALFEYICKTLDFEAHQETFVSIMTTPMKKLKTQYADHLVELNETDLAVEVGAVRSNQAKAQAKVQMSHAEPRRVVTEKRPANPDESSGDESEATEPTSSGKMDTSSDFSSGRRYAGFPSYGGSSSSSKRARYQASSSSSGGAAASSDTVTERRGGFFSERFTTEQRKTLGHDGERKVYEFLKAKHTAKYGEAAIEGLGDGYKINREDGSVKTVRWMNMTEEQFKPYDFEIIVEKADGATKVRHLEVKTTTGARDTIEVSYSAGEWQQMTLDEQGAHNSHRLFVVKASIDAAGGVNFEEPRKINLQNGIADQTVRVAEMKKLTISFGAAP